MSFRSFDRSPRTRNTQRLLNKNITEAPVLPNILYFSYSGTRYVVSRMLAVGEKRKDKSVGSGDGGDLWRIFFKMSSKSFSRMENMEAQTMRTSEGDQKQERISGLAVN